MPNQVWAGFLAERQQAKAVQGILPNRAPIQGQSAAARTASHCSRLEECRLASEQTDD